MSYLPLISLSEIKFITKLKTGKRFKHSRRYNKVRLMYQDEAGFGRISAGLHKELVLSYTVTISENTDIVMVPWMLILANLSL